MLTVSVNSADLFIRKTFRFYNKKNIISGTEETFGLEYEMIPNFNFMTKQKVLQSVYLSYHPYQWALFCFFSYLNQ
jgi:hypothetical protein